jgi:hypothetical protein
MNQQKRLVSVGFALAACVALSGCEQAKQALGATKQPPDEFAVFQRAPLSVPPDFGLRPPTPGTERPQAVNPRDQARAALGRAGTAPANADMSAGERSILQLTGANQVDPMIRVRVNDETRDLEQDSGSLTDKLVFWRKPAEFGTAVDPAQERKRIREAQAEGGPLNEGDLPMIKPRQKAIFER